MLFDEALSEARDRTVNVNPFQIPSTQLRRLRRDRYMYQSSGSPHEKRGSALGQAVSIYSPNAPLYGHLLIQLSIILWRLIAIVYCGAQSKLD